MSNTIPPFPPPSVPEAPTSPLPGAPALPASAAPPAPGLAAQTDSVTLSAAAQSSAKLLGAAQDASGINHAAIAAIRAQLANGTYHVSPETLAQAIATVLKETNP